MVDSCLIVGSGQYVYHYVNVVSGGVLYFADDGGRIDSAPPACWCSRADG
ncbi:MAG: hypothetical protein U0802_16825 [Candidatus Binatia bacterium]